MTPAPPPAPRLLDGPGPMDSPFLAAIAAGLAAASWRVVRFEFAYMARMRETGRRQGPERMPVRQEAFREQVRLGWIPSGDHSFKPTRSSGLSEVETWITAVARCDRFLLHCFRCSNSTAN